MSEETPPRRRARQLSEADREIWHKVLESVAPLKPKRLRRPRPLHPPPPLAPTAEPPPPHPQPVALVAPHHGPHEAEKPKRRPGPPPLQPIDRRTVARLVRGGLDIDARIDLHGMTQMEAHTALHRFLFAAQARGDRMVLVITGKGRASTAHYEHERGVLARVVPQWLEQPEFRAIVVSRQHAHVAHGGEGALYVRLRRPRPQGGGGER